MVDQSGSDSEGLPHSYLKRLGFFKPIGYFVSQGLVELGPDFRGGYSTVKQFRIRHPHLFLISPYLDPDSIYDETLGQ